MSFYPTLQENLETILKIPVAKERQQVLSPLIQYIRYKIANNLDVNLNFICTHNSRRSQYSQIWAQAAADYHQIPINSYSGGVEVTAFNERAVASVERFGFDVDRADDTNNPKYTVTNSSEGTRLICFSKLFNDPMNSADTFAAVMTCSDADENCPFIPGTEERIPIRYEDPKAFDDSPEEAAKYDERSTQIASEMFYVFGQVKN